MILLKEATAVTLLIGPFIDETDGKTAETGLTLTQADIRLSKNAGNMAQKNDSGSCTHDELGYYTCDLDATDTGTLGILKLMVHESGALPVWHEFLVVPANIYNSVVLGTDILDCNAKEISDDSTAADNLESACDNYSATRGLAGTALPAAAANAAGGLPISTAGGLDMDAILADTAELQGDWVNGGRLDLILDDILADTNELQTDDTPGAIAALNNISASDVTTDMDANSTKLIAIVGDTDEIQQELADGGRLDLLIDAILADTDELQTDDIPGTLAGLNDITAADVWDATEAITGGTLSFETIMARIYRFLFNKMNITDSSGAVALRNEGDSGDIMTNTITDNDTTTVRTAGSWS